MRDIFLNQIVDMTDPNCEFVKEFDHDINKYGAIVYNHESNSYQFIRRFAHIDFKREILPDLIRVENANAMLDAMTVTVHYEFDPEAEPETELDRENLDIWNTEISQIELPVLRYDDDGEYVIDKYIRINTENSKHTIWFLKKDSYNYILDTDLLMLTPIIKNINIARDLIKNYGINPFKFEYDPADQDGYEVPALFGVYEELEDIMDEAIGYEYEEEHEHRHYDEECDCGDEACECHHHNDECDCDDEACCCHHQH